MNRRGQGSIIALIFMFIMLVAYIAILPSIHAIIDDSITVNNYTGVIKVFLQFMPFMMLLIMLASMTVMTRNLAGGVI